MSSIRTRTRWVGLLLLALGLSASVLWSTEARGESPPSAADLAALEESESRWAAAGPSDYRMTYWRLCFCIFRGPVTVEVVDGVIVSALDEDGEPPPVEPLDVAGLFAEVRGAIERPVDSIEAAYDKVYGFPRRVVVDVIAQAIDDEFTLEVLDFEPLSTPLQRMELSPGWNLTTWTGATSVEAATASLAGKFDLLLNWDGARFGSYAPALPAALNTLSALRFGEGVWVHVTDPAGATWVQPSFQGERSVALGTGFQLVSWTGPDGMSVQQAVAGLGAALRALFVWDAASQGYASFASDLPAALNTASALRYGEGVWVDMREAAVWQQPAASTPAAASGEVMTLRVGERMRVESLDAELRVDGVRDDSRCPIDVVCVWEGEVTVDFTLWVGGAPSSVSATMPGGGATGVRSGEVDLIVHGVLPAPLSTVVLEQADYLVQVSLDGAAP